MGKNSNYITAEGAEYLRAELRALWYDERPRVTSALAVAAAEGDRSENAEYIYGKKRLREIDRKIRHLSKRLEQLNVVENQHLSRSTEASSGGASRHLDRVFFGAWVDVESEDGEVFRYRIVGPDETHIHPAGISIESPMGRALLGKSLDDEVVVRRPKGEAVFTVVAIDYQARK